MGVQRVPEGLEMQIAPSDKEEEREEQDADDLPQDEHAEEEDQEEGQHDRRLDGEGDDLAPPENALIVRRVLEPEVRPVPEPALGLLGEELRLHSHFAGEGVRQGGVGAVVGTTVGQRVFVVAIPFLQPIENVRFGHRPLAPPGVAQDVRYQEEFTLLVKLDRTDTAFQRESRARHILEDRLPFTFHLLVDGDEHVGEADGPFFQQGHRLGVEAPGEPQDRPAQLVLIQVQAEERGFGLVNVPEREGAIGRSYQPCHLSCRGCVLLPVRRSRLRCCRLGGGLRCFGAVSPFVFAATIAAFVGLRHGCVPRSVAFVAQNISKPREVRLVGLNEPANNLKQPIRLRWK